MAGPCQAEGRDKRTKEQIREGKKKRGKKEEREKEEREKEEREKEKEIEKDPRLLGARVSLCFRIAVGPRILFTCLEGQEEAEVAGDAPDVVDQVAATDVVDDIAADRVDLDGIGVDAVGITA